MENYMDISAQLKKELEALPLDYTRQMATRNWDVVIDMVLNFNIGRYLIFLDNFNKGISDKIRITKFGIDGPTTTAILYYDGNHVVYVIDDTRYLSGEFYTYYGNNITVYNRHLDYNEMIIDYYLIPFEGKSINILGIWAGLKPQRRV